MDKQLKTIEVYNNFVQNYADKFMKMDLYEDTWLDFLALLPQNKKLLELGCGPGNVIRFFLDKRSDLKITGLDLAPKMISFAQELNPTAEFLVQDIRKLDSITGSYDAVLASFCMPYLSYSDIDAFFQDLNRLTAENGLIYLSCVEGEKERSGFEKTSFTGDDEIHIYYHQRENVESLIAREGFKIEKFYTKDYPESGGTFSTDLIYIVRK